MLTKKQIKFIYVIQKELKWSDEKLMQVLSEIMNIDKEEVHIHTMSRSEFERFIEIAKEEGFEPMASMRAKQNIINLWNSIMSLIYEYRLDYDSNLYSYVEQHFGIHLGSNMQGLTQEEYKKILRGLVGYYNHLQRRGNNAKR